MSFWQRIIPHKSNKFDPFILRTPVLLVLVLVLGVLTIFNPTRPASKGVLAYATNVSVSNLHSLSNQQRTQRGLKAYALNSKLSSAAQAKAAHMFANNYWAHTAPNGTTPWSFITAKGYSYMYAGENLAKDFSTSSGIVNGWMGSTAHRANILSKNYVDVGYAAVDGTLLGKKTTLVVAMYAAPKAAKKAPASSAPSIASPTQPPKATTTPTAPKTTTSKPKMVKKKATKSKAPVVTTETKAPTNEPVESGEVLSEQTSLLAYPAKVYGGFAWPQRLLLTLLAYMLLIFILKHTLVWRHQKRGYRHIWWRGHPVFQLCLLLIAFVLVVSSGVGTVL